MEINEHRFNDIFLHNLASDIYTLESEDLADLQSIAEQCPFSGGKAVIKARAYLAIIGYMAYYDDETICETEEELRKASINPVLEIDVHVTPNPSKGEYKFDYPLTDDCNANISIYDCYGRIIFNKHLPEKSNSCLINIQQAIAGIYNYVFTSTNGILGKGKLILIK